MMKRFSLKWGTALAGFLAGACALLAAEPSDFAPKPPPCPLVVTVSLAAGSASPAVGRDIAFHVEVDNRDGRFVRVFNPFLSSFLWLPMELRIYDANGNQVATLGDQHRRGSMILPGDDSYIVLPPSGGVCIDWRWHCGAIYTPYRAADGHEYAALPPGKYSIQAVAYKALTTFGKVAPKNFTAEDAIHIWDGFDRGELCKSEMLPILIAESK